MPIRKREIAAYIILSSLGDENIDLRKALDLLEVFYKRRTARKILKMLHSAGFLEISGRHVKINSCSDAFRRYISGYIRARAIKRLKSYNIGEVIDSGTTVRVVCNDPEHELCKKREILLDGLVRIEFTSPQRTQ